MPRENLKKPMGTAVPRGKTIADAGLGRNAGSEYGSIAIEPIAKGAPDFERLGETGGSEQKRGQEFQAHTTS